MTNCTSTMVFLLQLMFTSKTINILVYGATSALDLLRLVLQLHVTSDSSSSPGRCHAHQLLQQQIWGRWTDLRTMADLLHQALMEE